MAVFNCACDEAPGYATLAELRGRLMVRLGYAAQVSNPPPGMAALLNDWLVDAQSQLYNAPGNKALHTERWFTWTMTIGERFYDIGDNDEQTGGTPCTKTLNPYRVTAAFVQDTNGAWSNLVSGIPPWLYTSIANQGMPNRYEIRQCIEIFPAPDKAYLLRVKGHFGLLPFAADTDTATVQSDLVFLKALTMGKRHYGHPDAEAIEKAADIMLKGLIGGTHGTLRYVPGRVDPSVPPQPVLILPP